MNRRLLSSCLRLFRLDRLRDLFACLKYLGALVLPNVGQLQDDVDQAGHPLPGGLREIAAGEEGLPVRSHEDGQRPASTSSKRLAYRHIDMIDIGTFFPIYLYRHEIAVEELRYSFIFK